jgi:hypothetical protein
MCGHRLCQRIEYVRNCLPTLQSNISRADDGYGGWNVFRIAGKAGRANDLDLHQFFQPKPSKLDENPSPSVAIAQVSCAVRKTAMLASELQRAFICCLSSFDNCIIKLESPLF